MNYKVVDKEQSAPAPRLGEVANLYTDLTLLMKNEPGKKLVIDFGRAQTGYRHQMRMSEWADEDGLTLFARAISGTGQREMFLERKKAGGA